MLGVVLLGAFFLQAGQAASGLREAQALLDQGKLNHAENLVRDYLGSHAASAYGHYLLGYVLFKEQNLKGSLEQYTDAARYRAPRALDLEVIGCDYLLLEDYAAADQ